MLIGRYANTPPTSALPPRAQACVVTVSPPSCSLRNSNWWPPGAGKTPPTKKSLPSLGLMAPSGSLLWPCRLPKLGVRIAPWNAFFSLPFLACPTLFASVACPILSLPFLACPTLFYSPEISTTPRACGAAGTDPPAGVIDPSPAHRHPAPPVAERCGSCTCRLNVGWRSAGPAGAATAAATAASRRRHDLWQ